MYIIQHRAKHRAILKSLFIKTRRIRRVRGGPLDADFHSSFRPFPKFFSFRSPLFHEEQINVSNIYFARTLFEEGNMAVRFSVERDAVAPSARRRNSVAN